ncbi:tyrosinase family protein [Streptomyces sp. CA-210063]|uniref:tyrosinase family protein n=1 Tax=Streptomyces sp. CA-210063 TaxID=2801029 RepID=UPI002F410BDA
MAPSCLPWQREFLLGLRRVNPSLSVPYWHWTRDRSLSAACPDPDLLGGNGRRVDHQVTRTDVALTTPPTSPRPGTRPSARASTAGGRLGRGEWQPLHAHSPGAS